jgi:pimeloyl-ACP methyl ester carboxylesterase
MNMFLNFKKKKIRTSGATINLVSGGSGDPVLLLHGYPETHAMWHKVAPELARDHTVVCADLRGYGESSKPPTTEDHEPYTKRAMARDCVGLMRALGHERFAVARHDRGSYVAFRTAMDHPDAVTALAVLDSSRSARRSPAPTRASRARGGTGSSSPRPRSRPSGSSAAIPTPGRRRPRSTWPRRRPSSSPPCSATFWARDG